MFNNLLERGWAEELRETRKVVQRDLEDQIEEEYKALGMTYQRTEKREKMDFSAREIVNLLQSGYTRYAKDDKGYGSIQAKYGLTSAQVVELFSNDVLKYKKTVIPKSAINLINDLEEAPAPQGGNSTASGTAISTSQALNELVENIEGSVQAISMAEARIEAVREVEQEVKVETEGPISEQAGEAVTAFSLFA